MTFLVGAVIGLTAVIAGALANHWVEPQYVGKVISAVRLQQVHGLVILAIGLAFYTNLPSSLVRMLKIAVGIFTLGILLFSGGIYLHYFLKIADLSFLVPIGGATVMVGWLVLIWVGFKHPTR